jgi:hydrogenase/urease accessory protein HupE
MKSTPHPRGRATSPARGEVYLPPLPRRERVGVRVSFLLLVFFAQIALAHEIRPAFLHIREVEAATYDILWKTPAQGEMRLALNVVLPASCHNVGEPRSSLVDGAVIQSWRVRCDGGLVGNEIGIEHLDSTLTDTILRFEALSGSPKTLRLNGATPRATIPAQQSWSAVAKTYFGLGVEHILFGVDHLLFVLCLMLLVGNVRRLVGAITAFTVAHSITLAGTTFGWVHLASAPVEASIALSIAFVAADILRSRDGRSSITLKWPWVAAFSFGLLHGFGFASALRQIGIPDDAAPLALLFFNCGVEAGQLLFIAVVLLVQAASRRFTPYISSLSWRFVPYAAGIVAAYWFLERASVVFLPTT